MELVFLALSFLSGIIFYGLHRYTRIQTFKKVWGKSDLWFIAKPKPTYRKGSGATSSLILPLVIEGNTVDLTLSNDASSLMKLFPKGVDWEGYVFTDLIKCCVVGKDIVGIQFGDKPPRDPEFDVELPSNLTPVLPEIGNAKKLSDIFLYISIISLIPAAFIFLQLIIGWFK